MKRIEFDHAYYLKLGRGGVWEEDSIATGKARIGYANIPLSDIRKERWTAILEQEKHDVSPRAVMHDFKSLKIFCEAEQETIWVTFHRSKLWWGFLAGPVQEDDISKYRNVAGGWRCTNIEGNGLLLGTIGGRLASLQSYRATSCRVHDKDGLWRLINAQPRSECKAIEQARQSLAKKLAEGVRCLHWKDFEILVDLIFRQAGWRRISVLGETMKFVDLELEEPVTGDKYQVQVKSQARLKDFETSQRNFAKDGFRKMYFVVHTPDPTFQDYQSACNDQVELVLVDRLAEMVIDSGLVGWLMEKIR